jgi:GTP cyclohydrolase I
MQISERSKRNGQMHNKPEGVLLKHLARDRALSDPIPAEMTKEGAGRNERLEAIVTQLLLELGVDIQDQHFRGTPGRVARLYRELTRGYGANPADMLTTFKSGHSELIVVNGINFNSLCPHHLAVYRGVMHFGYVPDGRIVGLSKIPRLIQTMAARMIVQEDLVSEIADTFMEIVRPLGCVLKATGRHDCVSVRGVKAHEVSMTTVALRGVFQQNPSLTQEFHHVL